MLRRLRLGHDRPRRHSTAWLHDPNAVKLGSKMPNYHLSDDEIDALVAYLESLT